MPVLKGIRVQVNEVGLYKMYMFEKWLNKFPKASWDTVIKALKEMDYNAAAKMIEDGRYQKSSSAVTGNYFVNIPHKRSHLYFQLHLILFLFKKS